MSQVNSTRNGCKDVWNAFMCKGVSYSKNDIPFCPTTATALQTKIMRTMITNLMVHEEYGTTAPLF